MTIKYTCSCGKEYSLKDELAGKNAKCKLCGTSFLIPASSPVEETPEQEHAQTKDCPFCGEAILSVAKKCKHCGEFLNEKPAGVVSGEPSSAKMVDSPMPQSGILKISNAPTQHEMTKKFKLSSNISLENVKDIIRKRMANSFNFTETRSGDTFFEIKGTRKEHVIGFITVVHFRAVISIHVENGILYIKIQSETKPIWAFYVLLVFCIPLLFVVVGFGMLAVLVGLFAFQRRQPQRELQKALDSLEYEFASA